MIELTVAACVLLGLYVAAALTGKLMAVLTGALIALVFVAMRK